MVRWVNGWMTSFPLDVPMKLQEAEMTSSKMASGSWTSTILHHHHNRDSKCKTSVPAPPSRMVFSKMAEPEMMSVGCPVHWKLFSLQQAWGFLILFVGVSRGVLQTSAPTRNSSGAQKGATVVSQMLLVPHHFCILPRDGAMPSRHGIIKMVSCIGRIVAPTCHVIVQYHQHTGNFKMAEGCIQGWVMSHFFAHFTSFKKKVEKFPFH